MQDIWQLENADKIVEDHRINERLGLSRNDSIKTIPDNLFYCAG